MLRKVTSKFTIGGDLDCGKVKLSTIHACKVPCHQVAVGYTKNLDKTHPHYLWFEKEGHLFLNMIDPDKPLFLMETFQKAMEFIDKQEREVFIHCNMGMSRSPMLALIWLARNNKIQNQIYSAAKIEYTRLDSSFEPSSGIENFVRVNWDTLMQPLFAPADA